ncbi:MAG: hypothetical protein J0L78_06135 [Planctomycetes bacterium]|nr:hypothetical protein [Planctomycetota bacterium]
MRVVRALNLSVMVAAGLVAGSFPASTCLGGYILSPALDPGASSVVSIGELVNVRFNLTSSDGSAIAHNSAIFRVEFSVPGLILESVLWTAPYETGTIFDDSKPRLTQLPLAITNDLLSGFGYAPNVADFELSNVVPDGAFTTGRIAVIQFRVPPGFASSSFVVRAKSDTIANGIDEIAVTDGPGLTFLLVPSPGAPAIAGVGLVLLTRRHRRPPTRVL